MNFSVKKSRIDAGQSNPARCVKLWPKYIEAGFARGYYQSAEFGLVRERAQLERTTAYLARLGRAPIWALPPRTWDALQGRGHKPRYVYDARDEAFRVPFENWARHRVAPN